MNEDGIIRFKELPKGNYTYQETKAPVDYVLDEQAYEFEISESGEVIEVDVHNKQILSDLMIDKTDLDTEEAFEGVEFSLLNEDEKIIKEDITNEDGKVSFKNLSVCECAIQEIEALKGYMLDAYYDVKLLVADKQVDLLKQLGALPLVVADAEKLETPHRVTQYVCDLAAMLHSLYNAEKVLGHDKVLTQSGLALIQAVKITLANGLKY